MGLYDNSTEHNTEMFLQQGYLGYNDFYNEQHV